MKQSRSGRRAHPARSAVAGDNRRAKRIGRPTATIAAPTLEVVMLGATVTVLGLAVLGLFLV